MTRRRQPPPPEPATLADDIPASTPWRDFVPAGIDLDRLADDLARAARWSIAQTDLSTAHPSPRSTDDAGTDLDAIDAWLLHLDALIDLNGHQGRRRACWARCLRPEPGSPVVVPGLQEHSTAKECR
jgi:hypothetical protein